MADPEEGAPATSSRRELPASLIWAATSTCQARVSGKQEARPAQLLWWRAPRLPPPRSGHGRAFAAFGRTRQSAMTHPEPKLEFTGYSIFGEMGKGEAEGR